MSQQGNSQSSDSQGSGDLPGHYQQQLHQQPDQQHMHPHPHHVIVPIIVPPTGVDLEQVAATDPDVLFRGAFGNNVPQFSVTLNRTNITPEGHVAGEPIFNFSNIPPQLRDLIEGAIRGGRGPMKKQATEDVINHLEVMDLNDLTESENCCAICYEPFDRPYITNAQQTAQAGAQKRTEALRQRFTEIDGDPGILIPRDATAKSHGELNFIYKKKFPKREEQTPKQPEHIPVKMPCNHIFGRSCLLEWLKSNVSCPLCRREVESQPVNPQTGANPAAESRAQSLIMNRAFSPADWASTELTNDDPAIPYPLATNSRRSGRGGIHGRTVIHFSDPVI